MAFVPTFTGAATATRSPALRCSAFHGMRAVRTPAAAKVARAPAAAPVKMGYEISDGVEFDSNPIVLILAFLGWVVPSSVPSGIPLLGGKGLTQAFLDSIGTNLAAWPKGPGGDDPFWTLLVLWHIGMFACMIFGSIGYNMRVNPAPKD